MHQPQTFRFAAITLGVTLGLITVSCSSPSSGSSLTPGSGRASTAPFDPLALSSRYVDRCVKDGGTVAQCGCQYAALAQRHSTEEMTAMIVGMETGGPTAVDAYKLRQEVASACR